MITPLMFILIIVVSLSVYSTAITNAVGKMAGGGAQTSGTFMIILQFAFPVLIPIGFILGSGLYCITCVRDRELGLRYLLNFAGMNPAAYYIGLICAEMVIFFIPCLLLILFSFLTNLEQFTNHAGVILTTLVIFGVPFIALNQLISFLFEKTETAFKYQALVVILSYAVPLYAGPYIGKVADPKLALYLSPVSLLNEAIINILLGEY
jgi:hypothetical protein